jgi:1-acyl-sn-glycerol-3-phosphate acyltransferase
MDKTTTSSGNPTFRPAKPAGWVIGGAQILNRLDLAWRNRLVLEERDLEVLRSLPAGAGIILASNHADETDMKVCLELSRRCRRRFLYMMNREAFDEGFGIAGWWLQRLGSFSIERGGHNEEAKRYAIDVVKRGREVLVIFPEGEIYYLNDLAQSFKSGVVDIGMQSVVRDEASAARLDNLSGPDGHQVSLPPAYWSCSGAQDTFDGTKPLPAYSR